MATRARQNELVQLADEVSTEVTNDAPHIARMVFGDNATHPDMAQVNNQRLDDVYRQAYQRGDREWLQSEARRDPEQFLKVAERIGARIPPPSPPPPAPSPPPMPAPAPLAAAPPPPVLPAPMPPPVLPAAQPLVPGPPPGPAPVILGPNGMPLPPSGMVA